MVLLLNDELMLFLYDYSCCFGLIYVWFCFCVAKV